MDEKVYLGDGVYVEKTEYGLLLTTDNGMFVTNKIVLEPEVVQRFLEYIERLKTAQR